MAARKSDETRERILEAAIIIFSQKGFSASTTSEIAREAEVAEGTIFKYFPRKKDLLHGVILKAVDIFGEIMVFGSLQQVIQDSKDKPLEEFLKAIALDRARLFRKYSHMARIVLNEMLFHEDIRQLFYNKIAMKAIELGTDVFEELKNQNKLRDVNSLVAVRSFMGMLFLMLVQRSLMPSVNVADNLEEELDMVIDVFLNGARMKDA